MSESVTVHPASSGMRRTAFPEMQIAVGSLLAGVFVLFVVQPYAAGYGDLRKSLFSICWDAWMNPQDSTWQHGVLAPFIAAWLVWQRRHSLAHVPTKGVSIGLVISLLALAFYYVGFKAHNYYLGAAGLMLLLVGGVLWIMGWEMLKAVMFSLFILGFMWPLRFLEDTLGFELRFLMVKLVGGVLDLVHAPIVRDGTTLHSSGADGQELGGWLRLNIEGPCSGMRSLFALVMVAALYSYHLTKITWKRAVLLALSLPLAVLGNMVRIFLLIIGSAILGQSIAVGDEEVETSTFHFVAGILVFVVAVMGLQLSARILGCESKPSTHD